MAAPEDELGGPAAAAVAAIDAAEDAARRHEYGSLDPPQIFVSSYQGRFTGHTEPVAGFTARHPASHGRAIRVVYGGSQPADHNCQPGWEDLLGQTLAKKKKNLERNRARQKKVGGRFHNQKSCGTLGPSVEARVVFADGPGSELLRARGIDPNKVYSPKFFPTSREGILVQAPGIKDPLVAALLMAEFELYFNNAAAPAPEPEAEPAAEPVAHRWDPTTFRRFLCNRRSQIRLDPGVIINMYELHELLQELQTAGTADPYPVQSINYTEGEQRLSFRLTIPPDVLPPSKNKQRRGEAPSIQVKVWYKGKVNFLGNVLPEVSVAATGFIDRLLAAHRDRLLARPPPLD